MDQAKKNKKYNLKMVGNDSYMADENVAYLVDYKVDSSTCFGTSCAGSIYIRGVKGVDGVDSFKFILEKANDFSDFDAELIVEAYEHALTKYGQPVEVKPDFSDMTPAQAKFAKR